MISQISKDTFRSLVFKNFAERKIPVLLLWITITGMVLIFSLSQTLGKNLKSRITTSGTAGNMIVVDKGADTPMFSSLPADTYDFIITVPHIKKDKTGILATRCLMLASLINGKFTMIRGVDPAYYKLNGNFNLSQGRLPRHKNEIVIGSLLQAKTGKIYRVNDTITFEKQDWKIAGIYEDRLSVMGSGIVTGLKDLQQATNREHLSFITFAVDRQENMETVKSYILKTFDALLIENPEIPGVSVDDEVEYYHHEADAINPMVMFINLINGLYLLAGLMIIHNIACYIFLFPEKYASRLINNDICRGQEAVANALSILLIALASGISGSILAFCTGSISINFMFMTFYLKSEILTMITGTALGALLAMAGAAPAVRKSFKMKRCA